MKDKRYRQGDVYLIGLEEAPKKANKHADKNCLARGEATGHHHMIRGDAEVYLDEFGNMIVKCGDEGAVLEHIDEHTGKQADHDPITLPANYVARVTIQEEYTPSGWKQVID